ncbi:hypothetical protein [Chromohalobacter canadensis]|uniref:Uncharacterized protein n=1 Tax=Chromohalobacter canadensis TaxID=141389 RepID=A0ABZ0YE95_9GAMM|nr:hypothetical protein [Chromohalobacter canadensis]MCK0767343.1 hypothetical protein [Chromohalobacter canadensis]WQH10053.1 hypothetical protein SR908_05130 [Chromohalobacter canadensis]
MEALLFIIDVVNIVTEKLNGLLGSVSFVSALLGAGAVYSKVVFDRSKTISEMRERWGAELRSELSVFSGALREYYYNQRKLVVKEEDSEKREERVREALERANYSLSKVLIMLPNKDGNDKIIVPGSVLKKTGEDQEKWGSNEANAGGGNGRDIRYKKEGEGRWVYLFRKLREISPDIKRKAYKKWGRLHKDEARDLVIRRGRYLVSRCYKGESDDDLVAEINDFNQIIACYLEKEWERIKSGEPGEKQMKSMVIPVIAFFVCFAFVSAVQKEYVWNKEIESLFDSHSVESLESSLERVKKSERYDVTPGPAVNARQNERESEGPGSQVKD